MIAKCQDETSWKNISIVGCVGLPPRYGGFETLAANIVAYRDMQELPCQLTVYCSTKSYPDRADHYGSAKLRYVSLNANGASSVIYDALSIIRSVAHGADVILVLGVSGAFILPVVRLVSRARLVVNIDGLEWKRPKWSRPAALFLKLSEWVAVRAAHVIVADNRGIVDHVRTTYDRCAVEIPYGGDHAVSLLTSEKESSQADCATPYALMLCRIEPENHIHLILEAFDRAGVLDLVAVGNWAGSDYGRDLRYQYQDKSRIQLLDPIFDERALSDLRAGAALYVHGHSAGGTNPALVEMMHFATPVIAFDCVYNRHTTAGAAEYFKTAEELTEFIMRFRSADYAEQGNCMRKIARLRYTWNIVGRQYFEVMGLRADRR